jgi:hypothetical protein
MDPLFSKYFSQNLSIVYCFKNNTVLFFQLFYDISTLYELTYLCSVLFVKRGSGSSRFLTILQYLYTIQDFVNGLKSTSVSKNYFQSNNNSKSCSFCILKIWFSKLGYPDPKLLLYGLGEVLLSFASSELSVD